MKNNSVNNKPTTAASFLKTIAQIGVTALAISAGSAGVVPANARPLTRPKTVYDPFSTLPESYTTNVTERAQCESQIKQLKKKAENFAPYRHTTLTVCPSNKNCTSVEDASQYRLRERRKVSSHDTQIEKAYKNAMTISSALKCLETTQLIQRELKNAGLDYKKNPDIYKQKMGEAILKTIQERQLKIDGVSLLIQDGVAGEELCMITDGRRKDHNPPRVVLVLDPKTCEAKGMHPMIKEIRCDQLCQEANRLENKYKPNESNSNGGSGADRG